MLTYQNDPAVKAMFEARFAEHRRLDQVTQGLGFDTKTNRGCFIGCTMNTYSHESFASSIGPQWLAHLAESIFEGLPASEAPQFGTDLLKAIPVGVDLEPVRYRFLLTVQRRNLERLAGNDASYAVKVRAAIQQVIEYLENPTESARLAAESARLAAESAAWSAARSARLVAARLAAESAAWSVSWSVSVSAARSVSESAESAAWSAESAAWSAEYQTQRNDLLALIREGGSI